MSGFSIRLRPHKVGSVCLPFDMGPYVTVSPEPIAEIGTAIACRVLTARREYGHLELCSGRQARLVPGDVIVGALGNRAALRGFCGRVPETLAAGDELALLNQGGVIGVADGGHVTLGEPIRLEVLGTPIRDGKPMRLADHAIPRLDALPERMPPVLILVGTSMDAGKSTAGSVIIRSLRRRGLTVHAGKVTGVAAIKDLLSFVDHGATTTLSFLDCGVPSTCYRDDVPSIARNLLGHLTEESPDLIVLEMGDGLHGEYGVDDILRDPIFARHVTGAVVAANDVIGGVAASRFVESCGIGVRVVTGPATDNAAGSGRLERMGIPAANTFLDPAKLCRLATAGMVPEASDP